MEEEEDGLQDGDASEGEGHESSYCLSGDVDADEVHELMELDVDSHPIHSGAPSTCVPQPVREVYIGRGRPFQEPAAPRAPRRRGR
jgi:hypothetical protein